MIPYIFFTIFFFALGACVGSFLNVVVWRLPRGESLIRPGSHCPVCNHPLAWRDNIPVFGWLILRGKCRYCGSHISARYPIVEAITGLLFAGYYVCFFVLQLGPCPSVTNASDPIFHNPIYRLLTIDQDWPIYLLYMFLVAALLAASLIDAELFLIPPAIPWWAAGVGIVVHAIIDNPRLPGAVNASSPACALALGASIGLSISLILLRRGLLPLSFEEGTPELEIEKKKRAAGESSEPQPKEYSRREIRLEMQKEMAFLIPPILLGGVAVVLTQKVPAISLVWHTLIKNHDWISGLLGAILGGLVGGFCVWFTRIFASIAFGREAMGLGDVDLMLGIGCVLGSGGAVVAFFLAPFCGIGVAVYRLLFRKGREIPYGPYLSMGAALVMLFYCPIASYFSPGMYFIVERLRVATGL